MGVDGSVDWLGEAGVKGGVLGTVVAVFVTTLVVYLVVVYQQRQKLPPGPWPWPIFGNLHVLTGRSHRNLHKLVAKYGGLMYLQLGQKPCLVVSTSAVAKDLFKVHDATFSSRPKRLAADILTGGTYRSLPLAPYGDYWRQLRRLSNTQLFSPAVHASHESIRNGEIRNMMRALVSEARGGSVVDLKRWLSGVTANNMTMMLTNNRFFDTTDRNQGEHSYLNVLRRMIDAFGALIISDYVSYLSFLPKLQGKVTELLELRRLGGAIAGKIIEVDKHRHRAAEETATPDENHVSDFVDVLLKAPLDDGKPLSDRDMTTLLLSFMNAGTDTSATTTEWAMAELMVHPDVRMQAQEELDAVVGLERLVAEADIPRLPFLQAIVKETFRLHPAAALSVRRESHQPCVISGFSFPAHTQLILNIYSIHRDPNVYENPDEFNPSRFLENPDVNHLSGHDSYQLIPFGVGRRMCPGANLGNALVTLMLANLLHSFDWSLPAGESTETLDMLEAPSTFIYCRETPLRLIAKPRSLANLY